MIPACDGRSDGRSDGQTESIMAKTALCIASYADALSKIVRLVRSGILATYAVLNFVRYKSINVQERQPEIFTCYAICICGNATKRFLKGSKTYFSCHYVSEARNGFLTACQQGKQKALVNLKDQ